MDSEQKTATTHVAQADDLEASLRRALSDDVYQYLELTVDI